MNNALSSTGHLPGRRSMLARAARRGNISATGKPDPRTPRYCGGIFILEISTHQLCRPWAAMKAAAGRAGGRWPEQHRQTDRRAAAAVRVAGRRLPRARAPAQQHGVRDRHPYARAYLSAGWCRGRSPCFACLLIHNTTHWRKGILQQHAISNYTVEISV